MSTIRPMSDLVREITGQEWIVYRLVNHTKREIYYGCTKDYSDRFRQHAREETIALKHWDFDKDEVNERLVDKNMTQREASALAHKMENQTPPELYSVITTCGI